MAVFALSLFVMDTVSAHLLSVNISQATTSYDLTTLRSWGAPEQLGDVNRDGKITIADVTALVDIILGKDSTEPYRFDHDAADVTQDSKITIADVPALVNIILGK
jgi:hypothetical protein